MKSFKVIIICCLLTVSRFLAYSSDGMLDRTFNHMMSESLPVSKAICVQSDGKMVTAGYLESNGKKNFAVARLLPNGMLDKDFANNGIALIQFGNGEMAACAQAVMIDSEGRIVAGGFTNAIKNTPHWALARLTPNGNLDKSFFGGRAVFKGTVITTFSSLEEMSQINGLAESLDGKIIAVGGVHDGKRAQFAIARYDINGSLDKTFNPQANNAAGTMLTQFGTAYNMNDEASAVAIDAYGKIVVGGSSYLTGVKTFALARYHPDGSLDASFFGGNAQLRGTVITNFAHGETHGGIRSLIIQADGKIVAGGYTNAYSNNKDVTHFALARYTAQGQLDSNFNSDVSYKIPGTLVTPFGSEKTASSLNALILQPDGKIVAGGWTKLNKTKYAALARYNNDGSLDYQFNGGGAPAGKVITDLPNGDSEICGLAFASTGDILAVGKNCCGSRSSGAVMQYMCDQDLCEPAISNPHNNQLFVDGSAVKISGKCHSPCTLKIYLNQKLLDTICQKGNCQNWSYTLPPLVSGDYEVSVIENYNCGKIQSQSNKVSIKIDQCPMALDQSISVCGKNPIAGRLSSSGASGYYIYSLDAADNGTVELNGADFVFNPSIDAGQGSFTFYVTDLTTGCRTKGKINVTVHEIPAVTSASFDTCNSANVFGNLTSFVKGGSTPYKIKIIEGSNHGLLNTREDGSFTFIPSKDFVGKTSFTYQVIDAHGAESSIQTMYVNVDPTPHACNVEYKTCQNKYVQGSLTSNGCVGIPPYHFVGHDAIHGKVTVEKNGMFMFFPEKDYVGEAEFEFAFTDAKHRTSNNAKVIIHVDSAPQAQDCTIIAHQGLTSRGSLAEFVTHGVLPYQFVLTEKPLHGQVKLEADGSFAYLAPNSDITNDSFEFIIKDVHGCVSNKAVARVTIYPKPQARDLEMETYANQPVKHDLQRALVFAKSPYFFETRGSVEHGIVKLEQDGSFTFIPEENYTGLALIKYVIIDAFGIESEPATINIIIHTPTMLRNGSFEMVENKSASFDIMHLVSGGVPPYTLHLVDFCEAQITSMVVSSDGMLQVTPKPDFNGVTICNYKAIDKNGNCSPERMLKLVIHSAPVATDVHTEVYERSKVKGSLQEAVSKGLQPYQFTLVDSQNGLATVEVDGSFKFEPTDGAAGMASFTYMVTDARSAQSKIATVYCAIQETPRINSVLYSAYRDKTLSADLNQSQQISHGVAPYTYMLLDQSNNDAIILNSDGTFNFTPSSDQNMVSFQYQVIDAKGGISLPATVTINVYDSITIQEAHFTTDQEIYQENVASYINGGVNPYSMQITAVENGTVELSQDGSFTFIPALDFAGQAGFTYLVIDAINGSNANGKVTIQVMPKVITEVPLIDFVAQENNDSLVSTEAPLLESQPLAEISTSQADQIRRVHHKAKNKRKTLNYLKRK